MVRCHHNSSLFWELGLEITTGLELACHCFALLTFRACFHWEECIYYQVLQGRKGVEEWTHPRWWKMWSETNNPCQMRKVKDIPVLAFRTANIFLHILFLTFFWNTPRTDMYIYTHTHTHRVDFSEGKQIKLIVLLCDFCNDEFLAGVLLVIPHRLPVTALVWEGWK